MEPSSFPFPLQQDHADKLFQESGIPKDVSRAVAWTIEDKGVASKILNLPPESLPERGIVFDFGAGYSRIRWDEPRVRPDGSEAKYDSPTGARSQHYDPPILREPVEDGSRTLFITEGEKKTLAMRVAGLAAIGIPGVDMLHDAAIREETGETILREAIKPLAANRPTSLVLDNDVDRKDQVMDALARNVRILEEAGAIPHVTFLPYHAKDKIGADDEWGSRIEDAAGDAARLEVLGQAQAGGRGRQVPQVPPRRH